MKWLLPIQAILILAALSGSVPVAADVPPPEVHYAITTVSDPRIFALPDESGFNDDYMLFLNFTQQIYNPYNEKVVVTYFSQFNPELIFNYNLDNDSLKIEAFITAYPSQENKSIASGLTNQSDGLSALLNESSLPYGEYTFAPRDHRFFLDDYSSSTVSHRYRINVTSDGIIHQPPELPEHWGKIIRTSHSSNLITNTGSDVNWTWFSVLLVPLVAMSRRSRSQQY